MAIYGPARRGGNRKPRQLQLQGSEELKSGEQITTSTPLTATLKSPPLTLPRIYWIVVVVSAKQKPKKKGDVFPTKTRALRVEILSVRLAWRLSNKDKNLIWKGGLVKGGGENSIVVDLV